MKHYLTVALSFLSFFLVAQKESFRIMTYNLMYYQSQQTLCSHTVSQSRRDDAFSIVFKEADPDILLVNELGAYTDNSGATYLLNNAINVDGEANFTTAAYSNNSFSDIVNQLFYDTTKFELHSQNAIATAVNGTSLPRVIDFYRLYYKDPGLTLGADTVFLTLVSAHLKAGQGSSNETERERAAEAIMKYLTDNVPDDNVILTGELDVDSGSEFAVQAVVNYTVASESFEDPINLIGNWHNNGSYALIHTQSTRSTGAGCFSGGGSDDRFDFILHSKAIDNSSSKINYKQGSYRIVGQDGQHFNRAINSGQNFQVSPQVANALYDFSDHMPVTADYEVKLSGIGIPEHKSALAQIQFNNPVNEQLTLNRVNLASNRLIFKVYSLTGREIERGQLEPGETTKTVKTGHWKAGVYLINISDAQGNSITRKLVKQEYAR